MKLSNALASGILSLVLFLCLYSFTNDQHNKDHGVDILLYEKMVNEAINEKAVENLSYAKQQQEILKEIKASLESIEANSKPSINIVESPAKVEVPPVSKPKVQISKNIETKQSPTRLPGSHWNVNGNFNYSLLEIANHLRTTHNIDPSGYTYEELTIIHDNLHNGYNAYGSSKNKAACPDGLCPQ